ncbi:hypothetical protein FPANT_7243 [Fusarium pseudoanthophilum]|uniref:Uncharacterized protein n=1 Tax=Fusarium pseudoanthophilum TaxID=48495 RepID=A0A8H5P1H3_9HYPO|nr:hypothetical protein FPANT_7243 [Fusarium pseudoanthophilum]
MKFLVSDSRTRNALKEWRKDAIIIAHFFWKPGSTMQHSFKGLLCSLLRLILTNDKSISNGSLQRKIKDKDGSVHQVIGTNANLSICYSAIANIHRNPYILRTLISPTIKLCVSSRPERLFRLHLQDKPSLKIHKLTRPDIEHYSKVSIRDSILLKPHGLKVLDLARDIGERSEGVFLWAVLVTRSLIRGINNGDSMREIYRRLGSTPQDLMDLYRDILKRSAADRDTYRQFASMMFNLVLVLNHIPMPLFEATVATDEPLLDRFVVRGKGIPAPHLANKGLYVLKILEVGCAGLLEVHSFMKDRPPTLEPRPLLAWLRPTITFTHRSAKEFLIDTEDGRKLWNSCPCSQEELLTRRAKAKLAWYELYASLGMKPSELFYVLQNLNQWIGKASLPSAVGTTVLTLAQKMYERGSLLTPKFVGELLPLHSRRGQFLIYAVFSGLITFALNSLATFPNSERRDTAYYIFYNACACSDPLDEEGYGLNNHHIVKFMIENGYSPNWPGSSERSTCKFGSP